jgi:two-component sensor histidine kinase
VKKRLLAVAATALLPAMAMLAYNEVANRRQRTAELHQQAAQAGQQASSEIDRLIDGVRSLLIASAAIPSVTSMDGPACQEALRHVAAGVPSIRTIVVVGLDGKLVCDSIASPQGTDLSDRVYVKEALATNELAVGEYTVSRLTGAAILPVGMPIRANGKVVGVIATGIRLDWLGERIRERGMSPGGALTIADRNGVIISRQPFPERFVGKRIPDEFQRLVRAPEPGTLEVTSQDGEVRIIGYRPVSLPSHPLYVSAGMSRDEALAPVNRATWTGVILTVLGAILACGAALFVGQAFILRPMQHIMNVIAAWRAGDVAARTRMEGRYGELGMVGASVDELLDELARRKALADRAQEGRELLLRELSHRVKNTLSIVQAIANQTFAGTAPTPDAADVFSRRVVALAGAYDILFADDWQKGEIGDVIHTALKPHGPPDGRRIRLAGPKLELSPQLVLSLSLVIHELATNATKYGALREPSGYVEVLWSAIGPAQQRVRLEWREHGGPATAMPKKEGFGTRLIRRAFSPEDHADVTFDYAPEGLRFTLCFDLLPASDEEPGEVA